MTKMQYLASDGDYVGVASDGTVVRVTGDEYEESLEVMGDDPVEVARWEDADAWAELIGVNDNVTEDQEEE